MGKIKVTVSIPVNKEYTFEDDALIQRHNELDRKGFYPSERTESEDEEFESLNQIIEAFIAKEIAKESDTHTIDMDDVFSYQVGNGTVWEL